jgi:DNA-binding transcriptional LysR family regulator
MEMHQIRYFLALCSEKNFTRAAQRCAVSQPSLTNAINRLEREIGGKLFNRGRRNSCMTELATALRPHLEMIEQSVRRAQAAAERMRPLPLKKMPDAAPSLRVNGNVRIHRAASPFD